MPSSRKRRSDGAAAGTPKSGKPRAPTRGSKPQPATPQVSDLGLIELISVAESAVGSLQKVFAALDASILHEFGAIAGSIAQAREDIGQLQPDELSDKHIPQAGRELAAIVEATEDATHQIMESAERILEANGEDTDDSRALIEAEVMKIFEACTFQDITGQRVTKVVDTLQEIEARVGRIASALGTNCEDKSHTARKPNANDKDKDPLLNGPQLSGQGVAQADVDALFN